MRQSALGSALNFCSEEWKLGRDSSVRGRGGGGEVSWELIAPPFQHLNSWTERDGREWGERPRNHPNPPTLEGTAIRNVLSEVHFRRRRRKLTLPFDFFLIPPFWKDEKFKFWRLLRTSQALGNYLCCTSRDAMQCPLDTLRRVFVLILLGNIRDVYQSNW